MNKKAAHQSLWQTSDAIFGLMLLLGLGLEYLFPLSFITIIPRTMLYVIGGALLLLGLSISTPTKRQLGREHQPSGPGRPTTKLLTDGMFGLTRNPMYLGLVLSSVGIGLLFNAPWLLILLILVIGIVHIVLIAPEEKYLAEEFGEEYEQYATRVRRWI